MGVGYEFECTNCGKQHVVSLGCGMGFPTVYKELVAGIEAGRYGNEWQELAAQTECFAIDAEEHLFRCEGCGHWECAPGLSIYAPKDVKKIWNTRFGEKTAKEWGRVPYVMAEDLKSDYTLVKECVHTCERCGHDMHMFTESGAQRVVLKCPDCGGRLERNPAAIMWD